MSLSTRHPFYTAAAPDWQQLRDTFDGERAVKGRGFTYLPPTQGMVEDGAIDGRTTSSASYNITSTPDPGFGAGTGLGNRGQQAYRAYRTRAWFPEWVKEAVKALFGTMHNKPATIELPPQMESMRENATARGESLQMLLQRINQEQLVVGRVGLLGDVIDSGERTGDPYLASYLAEDITNWDPGQRTGIEVQNLNMVVLDEGSFERGETGFDWNFVQKYRVLMLGDVVENEPLGEGAYTQGVFKEDAEFSPEGMETPMVRGRTASEIPFVFINTQDIVPEPDQPPLVGLSNLTLAIYRGEADYRQSLFMQGQDTLVVMGSQSDTDEIRVGAGARIDLTIGGDAKYIGVDSTGLSEQRVGLENDHNRAMQMSGQLLDSVSRERESGDALKVRVAVRTSTLNQIAIAGAFGLQEALKKLARWIGANDELVVVTPNLDFVNDQMSGKELGELVGAKVQGAPLSTRTIHDRMAEKGVTTMTFDEELEQMSTEAELGLTPTRGSTNPNGPEPTDPEPEPEPEPEPAGADA